MRPPAAPRRRNRSAEPDRSADRRGEALTRRPAARQAREVVQADVVEPEPARRREQPRRVVSTGLSARLAEQAQAARRLMLRRVGIAVAVVVLLGGLAWALLASPLLAVEEEAVEVSGMTRIVDRGAVRTALDAEIGTPLLRVDTAAVADRIRGVDGVEDVVVSRSWPRGLSVTVVPREPVAAARDSGRWVLVDDEGVQLATRRRAPDGLPRVELPLEDSGRTGPALDAVLTVLGDLPDDLRDRVSRAGAESPDQITLRLGGGALVRWGNAEENALKAEVLGVLLEEQASEYDVSVPRSPTTSG